MFYNGIIELHLVRVPIVSDYEVYGISQDSSAVLATIKMACTELGKMGIEEVVTRSDCAGDFIVYSWKMLQ